MKPYFKLTLFAAAVAVLVTGGTLTATADDSARRPSPELVRTGKGQVRGLVTADHRAFWGIPYATAARFTAPRPTASWTAVRDATEPGPACAQAQGNEVGIPSLVEDCLNLNVFTPAGAGRRARPVLVWVHGGSFKYGAGSMIDAGRLAARNDVVVVSINYRLGLLGSLAHPALDGPDGSIQSGAYGVQDQQAALRWVRDNARAFGGDPGNVTLAGESAGAYNTCAQLASPAAAGLFHRAIMQSAPCGQTWALSRTDGRARAADVARKLGCAETADVATCLRTADLTTLLKVTEEYAITPPVVGGAVLPLDPTQAITAGRFNRVPVLQGINHDEYQLMVAGREFATGHPLTPEEYAAELKAEFGAHADGIAKAYPVGAYPTPSHALAAVQTDHAYAYGSALTTALFAKYVPTYGYELAERNTPWLAGFPRPSFALGSYHMVDVGFVFTASFLEPLNDKQRGIADTIGTYWTAFARTGTPNTAGLPAWPPYDRIEYTQSLSSDRVGAVDFRAEHHYPLWADLAV